MFTELIFIKITINQHTVWTSLLLNFVKNGTKNAENMGKIVFNHSGKYESRYRHVLFLQLLKGITWKSLKPNYPKLIKQHGS